MSTDHHDTDDRSRDPEDAERAAAHGDDSRADALERIWDDLEALARRVDDAADETGGGTCDGRPSDASA